MKDSLHLVYIVGSIVTAMVATVGIWIESPLLYGTAPGIIGGIMALVATVRLFRDKTDLAGFVATICGFVYYQAFQANPVILPEFSASLGAIPLQDQMTGVFLGNLTTAMLLVSCHVVSLFLPQAVQGLVPRPLTVVREKCDGIIVVGFWITFALVALPNVLFGEVVVGAIHNIIYQRLTWADAENYSGFEVWGGALGASIGNLGLWAASLFLLWLYLLRSRSSKVMILVSPLVLLWTASVVLQGSRTYLVTMAVATAVYFFGDQKFGKRALRHFLWVAPVFFLLLQIATHFRGGGLQSVNLPELSAHLLDIRGNEGTPSQIDGLEYFRTELVERGIAPNPVTGFIRGLIERPFEGLLMPVPRSLFPWKADDQSGIEFSLFFQNVRLGVPSTEAFLGASPGLMGRELIKYGFLGPITLLFWLGLILALADRLFVHGPYSDFHRIFAALLVAFFVAQSRDFVPVWFIPFLPAGLIFGYVARRAKRTPLRAPSQIASVTVLSARTES